MPVESRLMVQRNGEITTIQFMDKNILDESSIQQIGEEILQIVEASAVPKIVIDFANVDHLSSAALGTLITVRTKVANKDGQLRLCNIDQKIYEIFAITKLNKLFIIHKNTPEALRSFK